MIDSTTAPRPAVASTARDRGERPVLDSSPCPRCGGETSVQCPDPIGWSRLADVHVVCEDDECGWSTIAGHDAAPAGPPL